jgi:DNA end-binding protein Ku
MSPRANWKGFLRIGDLTCPVALYTAVSTAERVAFHTLNRETGNRVHRQFVDQGTGRVVASEDQVKGYEAGKGDYVILEPEEIAAAFPESDKTLAVERFIGCDDIDDLYFDRPYYLGPAESIAQQAFALIRDGMAEAKVAALAQATLFRRIRTLLIRAHENGLIATLLSFDYEIRSAEEAFAGIKPIKINSEMLDLAKHIIKTKHGRFDPSTTEDRYEAALAELIKAKMEGKPIKAIKPVGQGKVVDLMDALRRSAVGDKAAAASGKPARSGGRRSSVKRARAAKRSSARRASGPGKAS